MLINGSRCALIRVLPGGIPNAVQPASDLSGWAAETPGIAET
jgi:hypothetical protein